MASAVPEEASDGSRLRQRQSLASIIQRNGARREDQRAEQQAAMASSAAACSSGATFAADLVFREEDGGFELWLGSLEDALSIEALRARGVNAVLNCAVEECIKECASFRLDPAASRSGGRRRTHARGASLAVDEEDVVAGRRTLRVEQVRGLVEFEESWYSDVLEYDMAYLGLPAVDEDGYRMDSHFPDVKSFLGQCRQEGRKVLIHCVMGINRSSVALVAFLCSGLGMDLSSAVDLASKQRGYILSNESFLDQLIANFGLPESQEAKPESR